MVHSKWDLCCTVLFTSSPHYILNKDQHSLNYLLCPAVWHLHYCKGNQWHFEETQHFTFTFTFTVKQPWQQRPWRWGTFECHELLIQQVFHPSLASSAMSLWDPKILHYYSLLHSISNNLGCKQNNSLGVGNFHLNTFLTEDIK
jgi:hypothetical protein